MSTPEQDLAEIGRLLNADAKHSAVERVRAMVEALGGRTEPTGVTWLDDPARRITQIRAHNRRQGDALGECEGRWEKIRDSITETCPNLIREDPPALDEDGDEIEDAWTLVAGWIEPLVEHYADASTEKALNEARAALELARVALDEVDAWDRSVQRTDQVPAGLNVGPRTHVRYALSAIKAAGVGS